MQPSEIIVWSQTAFELVGVAILIIGSLLSLVRLVVGLQRQPGYKTYQGLRQGLGRTIVLSLEVLVAADIIRSVALEPTLQSVGVLALIVLVRTFLSWSLEVEITGRWPWQHGTSGEDDTSGL